MEAIHDCPAFNIREATAASAALTKSASPNTINASLPPSSNTCRLIFFPAREATAEPAISLPVNATPTTERAFTTCSTFPEPISKDIKVPFGKPTFKNNCSINKAEPKTLDECFNNMVLPTSNAGMAARKTCQNGKFQGITAKTVPKGK